ncbi:MAG: hypothetical protein SW833_18620 [Cyanobacteriota bacterium]|nr:hypothetical protein [Cyanobacteriota bacterium]
MRRLVHPSISKIAKSLVRQELQSLFTQQVNPKNVTDAPLLLDKAMKCVD